MTVRSVRTAYTMTSSCSNGLLRMYTTHPNGYRISQTNLDASLLIICDSDTTPELGSSEITSLPQQELAEPLQSQAKRSQKSQTAQR